MRIMLTIAAASMMVPTIAVAQTDMSGSTSMSSKPMKSSKPKKHKTTTNGAMSSGTTGQTSNTESGQTTPQSAPGASTDGSMPDKSSSAPIATSGTTPPQ